ncbi:unnamed protein product [Clonostachys chloroleuca]|uniref:Carboxylesterase type B domain-containing protein n=1 Tax=Clonostachys chloroleuca TaxID=1926264 RepID=A0AA35LQX7_9HYPO|nr:unnamed protein product [Clonostachys chloroleuca]
MSFKQSKIAEGVPPPLQHTPVGSVQGKFGKGSIEYLGIRYASLEHRLVKPKVIEYARPETLDATKHGPPVVTPAGAIELEQSFIQQPFQNFGLPPMSDTEGLNLNITVPLNGGKDLPVLVYIHGGGFQFGSGTYSHYD